MRTHLVIATRGSRLALWQAEYVKSRIQALHPDITLELCIIKTKGDIILDVPLAQAGGKGLFVKEIETALLGKKADMAVHSMKDVPMQLPEGLELGCIPQRENPSDCLISCRFSSLESLPQGARVGTSSLRRQAQLLSLRPDIIVEPLRGNIDTRLRKLQDGTYDAIILATAGLRRLNLEAPYMCQLEPESFLPAVGQGALGIECRCDATDVLTLLKPLEDKNTRICVEAERGFLAGLEGDCQVPIAAHAKLKGDSVILKGLVAEVDGSVLLQDEQKGPVTLARQTGFDLAEKILSRGGRAILDRIAQHA